MIKKEGYEEVELNGVTLYVNTNTGETLTASELDGGDYVSVEQILMGKDTAVLAETDENYNKKTTNHKIDLDEISSPMPDVKITDPTKSICIKDFQNPDSYIYAVYECGKPYFPELDSTELARYVLLATHIEYENVLCYKNKAMAKMQMAKILGLSDKTFPGLARMFLEKELLIKKDKRYFMPDKYFFKGEGSAARIKRCLDEGKSVTKIYFSMIRDIYANLTPSTHRTLGHLLKLLPYTNKEFNILCSNQNEKTLKEIVPLTAKDICDIIKVDKNHSNRTVELFENIKYRDWEGHLTSAVFTQNETIRTPKKIYINPRLYLASDRWGDILTLGEFYEKEKTARSMYAKIERPKNTGNRFILMPYEEQTVFTMGLSRLHFAHFIYISTFIDYNGQIIYKKKAAVKSDIADMLNLTPKAMESFWNGAVSLNLIKESAEGIWIPKNIMFKGEIPPELVKEFHEKKSRTSVMKIYINKTRRLYEELDEGDRYLMGGLYSLIPYTNKEYNVLCHSVNEENFKRIIRMRESGMAALDGFNKTTVRAIIDRLGAEFSTSHRKLAEPLLFVKKITPRAEDPAILSRRTTPDLDEPPTITINPRLFFVGNDRAEALRLGGFGEDDICDVNSDSED